MMIDAQLTGSYPRSERLVAATRAAVRGNLPQTEVDLILQEDVRSLVTLQGQCELGAAVDGQLNWQDLFRPFSEILTGIEPGGLVRWFDNNTFYRQPLVKGRVGYKGDSLGRIFRIDLLPKEGCKKAILPGPFTFALLSENSFYKSNADLVDDLAHSLKSVVRELQSLGYDSFQFNEPCLCAPNRTKSEFAAAQQGLQTCAQGRGLLQTYFGDASRAIDRLLDYPVDSIGVDLYSTPLESLKGHDFDKGLACGCVDGRNSLLESPTQLKEILLKVRNDLEPRQLFLTTSCDLEFLPSSVAEKKVRLLNQTEKLLA